MEYSHGVRVTAHYHEASPLERAIQNFEKKAFSYHNKTENIPTNETPASRLKREQDLNDALKHLKQERLHIKTLAQIQERLEEYRKQASTMTRSDFRNENYHPAKKLASNLRASGRPQPNQNHSPHHIIMGKGRTQGMADARLLMFLYKIRINDPDNGTWMPRHLKDKGHWSMPRCPAHSEIHGHNYEIWISTLTQIAMNEKVFRATLLRIRSLLRDGRQPQQVTQPKKPDWDGLNV